MSGKLTGRVALITGAGSGMAKASAKLFASEGAKVVAADLNLEAVQATVAEIGADGGDATAVQVDVSDEVSVQAMVASAVSAYGRIDILFNVAGIPQFATPIEEVAVADFQRILSVNVVGPWLCAKHAVPELRKTGDGVILNISSVASMRPRGGTCCYSCSKGAINTMSRALAVEFAPEVRVNTIMPGPTDTPMMKGFIPGFDAEKYKGVEAGVPLGKFVQPEDVAYTALFLCTNPKVTGAEIRVDSGLFVGRGDK
ncbi:MAG: SDR family oxidoreductase [Clostridiales Family XIII bacterium]|jgi:3-oxoacyl-[acyl-carrier protein] reductase|nr:SDR family oxidoreductase [Clostridiales Family XIII bacterium]